MVNSPRLKSDNSIQQNLKIFDIYNIYRLVLSLILLITFLIGPGNLTLGTINGDLFTKTVSFYILFNSFSFFRSYIPQRQGFLSIQLITIIVIDILVLTIIGYSSGGVGSGVAYLAVVPIAASSILFPGKLSLFLVAIATISVTYGEAYLHFSVNSSSNFYIQVTQLGLILLTLSILLQYLSGRIRRNELITKEQAQSIESLEAMNYQIIQRMQTGIIVISPRGDILNFNSSAQKLLQDSSFKDRTLPLVLAKQLGEWKISGNNPRTPFQPSNSSPKLQASFSYLNFEKDATILIFLEDFSLLSSRAQHLKLMSLGRLTASIAHEIRNPLGAISHAGQLLGESKDISSADKRLLEIIDTHSKRVNSIIENVLQLSRDKNNTTLNLIAIQPWLDQFLVKFSNSYSYKDSIKINIEINDENILIRFNQSLLEQLLTNLCDNGLRYSIKKTGLPHLTIKIHKNSLTQAPIMEIIDDGGGVPEDHIENIFEPFFTTENSGTGLGLFICEEICQANQAQLSYTLYKDKGSSLQKTSDSSHAINDNPNGKSCFRISFAHPDRTIL